MGNATMDVYRCPKCGHRITYTKAMLSSSPSLAESGLVWREGKPLCPKCGELMKAEKPPFTCGWP